MDIKGHSTMIIAMAIAVVITTGVMVPIITDSLDNAGSGGGSASDVVINKGTFYLKETDNGTHTISVAKSGDKVIFTTDNEKVGEMTMGTTAWCVPFYKMGDTIYIVVYEPYSFYMDNTIIELDKNLCIGTYVEESESMYCQWDQWFDTFDGTLTGSSMNIDVTYDGGSDSWTETDISMYMDKDGSYVWAESPTVLADTEVSMVGFVNEYSKSSPQNFISFQYASMFKADLSDGKNGYNWDGGYISGNDIIWYNECYPAAPEVSVTDVSGGYKKINSLTISADYEDENGGTVSKSYTFKQFLVPTEIEPPKEAPVNGFWALADENTSQIIRARTMNGGVSLYDGDWGIDEQLMPYFSATEISTFIPIAIGEGFSVIIDGSSARSEGYNASMYIFGDNSGNFQGSAEASQITIDGTQISFYDSRMYEPPQCVLNGLIAYLAPDGSYTSVTDSFKIDSDEQIWTALFEMNSAGNVIIGGTADSSEILNNVPAELSVEYLYESGTVSGLRFTVDDSPAPSPVQMTIQPIAQTRGDTPSSIDYEYPLYDGGDFGPTKYMFSVIPIEEEESGGSGGSLSPALVAMVTAIPIVVIAGLVLVGVGVMRGGGA